MYRLKNWYLDAHKEGVRGHGDCYDNPRFFSGQLITTSYIKKIEVEDEESRLKLFTESGSCYVLEFADINDVAMETTQKMLESMNAVVDLQKCIALKEERIKSTIKGVSELLKPNELYVFMTGGQGIIEAYFKSNDDAVVSIPVRVHIGTIQDSIIVADWVSGLCDWRIFPSVCVVKPYHWSDNIEAVYIENVGETFVFMGSKREIPCNSGEVTVIKSEEYTGEGLFSPDAVNGKCLFSAGASDDKSEEK